MKIWQKFGLVLSAIALVITISAVAKPRSDMDSPSELEQRQSVDVALVQLLAARRSQEGRGFHRDAKALAKARMAMRTLEGNLNAELHTVRAVIEELDRPKHLDTRSALVAQSVNTRLKVANLNGPSEENNAAWQKKTMQRGALRGESTASQLKKVLEKDLDDKIHDKIQWNTADLKNAADFADYLKSHPLPSARLLEGAGSQEKTSSQPEDNGIVKLIFQRETTMTEEQYKAMQDELKKQTSGVSSTTSTAWLSKTSEDGKGKDDRLVDGLSDEQREALGKLDAVQPGERDIDSFVSSIARAARLSKASEDGNGKDSGNLDAVQPEKRAIDASFARLDRFAREHKEGGNEALKPDSIVDADRVLSWRPEHSTRSYSSDPDHVLSWRPEHSTNNFSRAPSSSDAQSTSDSAGLKRLLGKILGESPQYQYQEQVRRPADGADEAGVKQALGSVKSEMLRGSVMGMQPYYWGALPSQTRQEISPVQKLVELSHRWWSPHA